VIPHARSKGLGKLLLLNSINGYAKAGIETVQLEVTANNITAVKLYESVGFKLIKVLHKPAATVLI
jgi:ribosomal protein S18 acetylase RimI-like enzyme